jgi:hypothetical protein
MGTKRLSPQVAVEGKAIMMFDRELRDLRRDWCRWRAAERIATAAIALAAIEAPAAMCIAAHSV